MLRLLKLDIQPGQQQAEAGEPGILLWELMSHYLHFLRSAKFWALKMGIKSLWLIAKMAIVTALRSRDERIFQFSRHPIGWSTEYRAPIGGLLSHSKSVSDHRTKIKLEKILGHLSSQFSSFWMSELCFWLNAKFLKQDWLETLLKVTLTRRSGFSVQKRVWAGKVNDNKMQVRQVWVVLWS